MLLRYTCRCAGGDVHCVNQVRPLEAQAAGAPPRPSRWPPARTGSGQRLQALYGRATGQLKNLGMTAFMMWMSGSQIQIFSIMMTANGIYQPILAISKSGEGTRRSPGGPSCWGPAAPDTLRRAVFPAEHAEGGQLDVLRPRLLYILIQLAGLAFGLWKLAGMGLLPTHASDFVSALAIPRALESSTQAIQL